MAHPLNRPCYDERLGRVTDGYSILQPRVGISMPSAGRSRFARLFAGDAGIDPYTRAVSDVYQDLFGEGSFIGKGIYDVDALQQAIGGRFPENRILSHDLLEGALRAAGLVSDVHAVRGLSRRYPADVSRRYRWIRGDWQIAPWLLPRVPGGDGGRVREPASRRCRGGRSSTTSGAASCRSRCWRCCWSAGSLPGGALVLHAGRGRHPLLPALLTAAADWRGGPPTCRGQHGRLVGRHVRTPGVARGVRAGTLPYDAYISLDAIVRTRRACSSTGRSCWNGGPPATPSAPLAPSLAGFYASMWVAAGVAAAAASAWPCSAPVGRWPAAGPVVGLWFVSPAVPGG